jgi:glycosyltransferase involved in cell wall biosynthesis
MTRQSFNVAFLTSARAWRGSGVSLSNIASGLAARGHRVHMLAGEDSVVEAFARRALPATRVPTGNTGLRGARAVVQALRALMADCLVVDRPRDLRLGALAAAAYPVALVNRYNLSRRTPPRDLLSRLAYLAVRLTIFVSESSARQALARADYLRRYPHQVIPEGVGPEFRPDPDGADVFRARYGLTGREFLLAVGSLTADKRYDFLFDVMTRLGSDAPLLVICGAGPLGEELKARAAALELEVRFLGQVSPELLPGAYSAAISLVHTCGIETFGLSVLEAMACGRPVLAVDGGAVPEVLGGAGVLSPPNDPEAFGARLRELLADPQRRLALGTAARRRARQFSLSEMQQAYSEAIERVCSATEPATTLENAEAAPPRL